MKRQGYVYWLASFVVAMVLACSDSNGKLPDNMATANISGYNHTAEYIHQFYVDDAWGGNVFAYAGGGKFVCCLIYPRQWKPGLQAKVRWTTSSSDPAATGEDIVGKWHEAVVSIEKYDKTGTLNVHFLPDGKIRLIVSNMSDIHPDYPGPRLPPKPKDFKW